MILYRVWKEIIYLMCTRIYLPVTSATICSSAKSQTQ